jgi:hypothetical protein
MYFKAVFFLQIAEAKLMKHHGINPSSLSQYWTNEAGAFSCRRG